MRASSVVIPNLPILEGRDAVVGTVRTLPPTSRLEIEPREIIGRGDIAVVRGSYAVDGDHGRYIEVWQRQAGGAWRIIRDTWNSDRPAAAVPNPAAEEDAITDVVHATGAALNRRDWLGAGEPARDRATYVLVRSSGRWEVAALRRETVLDPAPT